MELLINVDIPDLEQAIAFYQRAAGLQLGRRLFDGTVAEMVGATSPIYLLEKAADTSPSAVSSQRREYRRHWTPLHLDFVVADVDAAVKNAMAAGATLESGSQSFPWGRLATLGDPFGHGICFVQWFGRGYDEVT